MTCPGRVAVLQHALVGIQFNGMSWSRRSFTTCNGRDTVIRLTLIGIQFYKNIYLKVKYLMYIKIRVQWTFKIYIWQKQKYHTHTNEINI